MQPRRYYFLSLSLAHRRRGYLPVIAGVIAMNTKICARCGLEKELSEFYVNSHNKDGLHSYCKTCNKEKAAAYMKTYMKTDKGKAALSRAIKDVDRGYYRFGKGAIPIFAKEHKKEEYLSSLTAESLEKWWHGQADNCSYCGISLDEYLGLRDFILSYKGGNFEINKFKRFYRSQKHQSIRWLTIDRINNNRGYEIENIAEACWICNSLKSDFFDGEQIRLIGADIIVKLKSGIRQRENITTLSTRTGNSAAHHCQPFMRGVRLNVPEDYG